MTVVLYGPIGVDVFIHEKTPLVIYSPGVLNCLQGGLRVVEKILKEILKTLSSINDRLRKIERHLKTLTKEPEQSEEESVK